MINMKFVDILELHIAKFRQVLVRNAKILEFELGILSGRNGVDQHRCSSSFHTFDVCHTGEVICE